MKQPCPYCAPSAQHRQMKTANKAYKLKIGKQWGRTKLKESRLMIGEWNGYLRTHSYKGSLKINFCPMCGRDLNEEKERYNERTRSD